MVACALSPVFQAVSPLPLPVRHNKTVNFNFHSVMTRLCLIEGLVVCESMYLSAYLHHKVALIIIIPPTERHACA